MLLSHRLANRLDLSHITGVRTATSNNDLRARRDWKAGYLNKADRKNTGPH